MGIAQSALAAVGHEQRFAIVGDFPNEFIRFRIRHPRAERNRYVKILPGFSGAVAPTTLGTALAAEDACVTEIHERIESFPSNEINAAAVTAVTAVRSAAGDEFLAPER